LSWLQDIIKGKKANQADHHFKIQVKVQKFQENARKGLFQV